MNVTATPGRSTSSEVVSLGETMVMVTPTEAVGLTAPGTEVSLQIGGAESNVAMSLVQLGVSAAWWSRVGDDPLGRFVVSTVEGSGVQVFAESDPSRKTGIYFKDIRPEGTQVIYYREGSAASAMSPQNMSQLPLWHSLLHLSGITPALSPTADALIEALLKTPRVSPQRISFDVNHRPHLWPMGTAGPRLLELANLADIVFVGLDEATQLWGAQDAQEVRKLLAKPHQVIVKDGPRAATAFEGERAVTAPVPPSRVKELVGAGDAFAAGYLAAMLRTKTLEERLTAGHLAAMRAIQATSDVPVLPPLDQLLKTYNLPV